MKIPFVYQVGLLLQACRGVALDSCWFENFHLGVKEARVVEGVASPPEPDGPVWFGGGNYGNLDGTVTDGTAGITLASSLSGPAFIWPNGFARVANMVDASEGPAGAVVTAQFNDARRNPEDLNGQIKLPSTPNKGLFASPTVSRIGGVGREFAGLIIPSLGAYSEQSSAQYGMLYYDTNSGGRFRVLTNGGGWHTVSTA